MVSEDTVQMGTGRLFHATGEVTKNVCSSQVDHWVSKTESVVMFEEQNWLVTLDIGRLTW